MLWHMCTTATAILCSSSACHCGRHSAFVACSQCILLLDASLRKSWYTEEGKETKAKERNLNASYSQSAKVPQRGWRSEKRSDMIEIAQVYTSRKESSHNGATTRHTTRLAPTPLPQHFAKAGSHVASAYLCCAFHLHKHQLSTYF